MIEKIKEVLAKVKEIVQKFKIVIVAGIGTIIFILTFLIGRKKPTSSGSSSSSSGGWGGGSSTKPPTTGSPGGGGDDKPGTIIANQQKIDELNHQIETLKQKLDNLSKEEQEILNNYEKRKNDLDNETIESLLERLKAATSKPPPAKPTTKPRGRRITRTQLSNNNTTTIPSITRTSRAARLRKKKEGSPPTKE
jgi:TolA-binding protein